MSILVHRNTRVVVQGITGKEGSFHTAQAIEYGTKVVAGVTPGKGGTPWEGKVPVFDTVRDAVRQTGADLNVEFEYQVRMLQRSVQEEVFSHLIRRCRYH